VKRSYAPKNALDPVAEFFQSESEGNYEEEDKPKVAKAVTPVVIPKGLLELDFNGHVEELLPKSTPVVSHSTISTKDEVEKKKLSEDFLAMFEEDSKKNKTSATSVKGTSTSYMAPNKYAALDFVQAPAVANNVYNIYNTYNMNISTGPNINYRYPPNNMPKKEVTYQCAQYNSNTMPKTEDNKFKDILPDDF